MPTSSNGAETPLVMSSVTTSSGSGSGDSVTSNGSVAGTNGTGTGTGTSNKEMLSISGKKKCSYCDDELGEC